MFSRPNTPELHFLTPAAPTAEKLEALEDFLADFKGLGCRFALTAPTPGQPGHAVRVLAYAPDGKLLAELRALLPDDEGENIAQVAALVGVWAAAGVRTV